MRIIAMLSFEVGKYLLHFRKHSVRFYLSVRPFSRKTDRLDSLEKNNEPERQEERRSGV